MLDLSSKFCSPTSVKFDLVWNFGWYFRGEDNPRPNCSGFMQDVVIGEHLPPGDIRMLPMIDMNPSDR